MLVTIELLQGPNKTEPDCWGIQKNIDALQRFIDGKQQVNDFILINDTISILEAIQKQLRGDYYGTM